LHTIAVAGPLRELDALGRGGPLSPHYHECRVASGRIRGDRAELRRERAQVRVELEGLRRLTEAHRGRGEGATALT
jgi:hypothetical protein